MTDDGLAAWLLEQIAEDEATYRDPEWWDLELSKRMLAECDAKRRIVEMHAVEDVDGRLTDGEEVTVQCCVVCRDENGMREEEPCPTLRLLGEPMAHRPGYREEWKP